MITASQARKRALKKVLLSSRLVWLREKIEERADRGFLELFVEERLTSKEIVALNSLGFQVYPEVRDGVTTCVIMW
jgi:hypothetical protein